MKRTYSEMITEVSNATANVVMYGPERQTWYDQQQFINEIKDLKPIMRTVVKGGSLGDDRVCLAGFFLMKAHAQRAKSCI